MNRRELFRYLGMSGVALYSGAHALAELQTSSFDIGKTADPAGKRVSIFLNQLGYLPDASKQASISGKPGKQAAGAAFRVRSVGSRAVVLKGTLETASIDAASGDSIQIADFSSLQTPGTYILEAGGQASDAFSIQKNVYADALKLTMRSYYGQRCGCAVDLGGGFAHPACHGAGAYHASSGHKGPAASHGGWHDAGDYGRYVVNSGITTGTLLWAWEMYPQALAGLSLAIPESGGKLPDFLAEVRWNLDWMLTMQDADGGVWHKQTSEKFCGFVMPQDDTLVSYVIGTGSEPYKSTAATADLAAVMAIAARCYTPYDAEFAKRCLDAAKQAWSWAIAYPDVVFKNPLSIATGEYGDRELGDEVLWASAELWRTTGETQYEKSLLDGIPSGSLKEGTPGWGNVASMAFWTYALSEREGNASTKARIREATLGAASAMVARSQGNGYGNTLSLHDYVWGSNGEAANQSLLLLVANKMHPDRTLREAALGNLHYLVGRNCFGVSWVTGLGLRPFQHPHHRPSIADRIPAPWPGLLSGGPNARGGDEIAAKLPVQPPMRMWLDDQRAYSLNEIAINWNAPLVFLLAAANA